MWIVANDDRTLGVDVLGTTYPMEAALKPGESTRVRLDANWTDSTGAIEIDVFTGPVAGELSLKASLDHAIALDPPPAVAAAIAITSICPGIRRFMFDDVTLDLR